MHSPDLYGPWPIQQYEVRIDTDGGIQLKVSRNGEDLKTVPAAVRESPDFAWVRLALEAMAQHRRHLKALLENAMVERIPLSSEDLAMLALEPVGRSLLSGLLVTTNGITGLPLPELWTLQRLNGELVPLEPPVEVAHPVRLQQNGTLDGWRRWLAGRWLKQPFKQIRRELYFPTATDRAHGDFTDRCSGEHVRWDQARALLEGRNWRRVTKTGAERGFHQTRLTAFVEFRSPIAPGTTRADVRLDRLFFLPRGEYPANSAHPGIPLDHVPAHVFSEAVRDVELVAQVAGRRRFGRY